MDVPTRACRRPRAGSMACRWFRHRRRHRLLHRWVEWRRPSNPLRLRHQAAEWRRPSNPRVLRRTTAMSSKRLLIIAALSAALGGCATAYSHIGDEDAAFGEAAAYDKAIQTINPAPVYSADSAQPGSNGDKGAAAVERYRTDKVKPVETMGTTSGVQGSSGMSTGG